LILREIEKKLGLATVLSRHIPDDSMAGVSGTATAT
jgi:hypothetical protein